METLQDAEKTENSSSIQNREMGEAEETVSQEKRGFVKRLPLKRRIPIASRLNPMVNAGFDWGEIFSTYDAAIEDLMQVANSYGRDFEGKNGNGVYLGKESSELKPEILVEYGDEKRWIDSVEEMFELENSERFEIEPVSHRYAVESNDEKVRFEFRYNSNSLYSFEALGVQLDTEDIAIGEAEAYEDLLESHFPDGNEFPTEISGTYDAF